MSKKIDVATVKIWGYDVGAVAWQEERAYAVFEYEPGFIKRGLDLSPIHMSIDIAKRGNHIFSFPGLNKETFRGLPGLLADALPDKFGNSIIDNWLARQGRATKDFSPVERLCYMETRSMGALEFKPGILGRRDKSVPIEISDMVELVQDIMDTKSGLHVNLGNSESQNHEALMDIVRVGTSAGGARPKAVIAINSKGDVISGQGSIPEGFEHWIIKFDGVTDLELGKPRGYGRIEYAYYLMAQAAGIYMTECRLLEENGRAHFMTKRFDREQGRKLHMHSLCGIAHYDFNQAGAYSYEQAFAVMRTLHLSKAEILQQYRRMIFNVIARNQDDHTKNINFLMDQEGKWYLSPAFDVTYSHNPSGVWTNQHQMSLNNKRDNFTMRDLTDVGDSLSIRNASTIIDEVCQAVESWSEFANDAQISQKTIEEIGKSHRLLT